MSRRVLMLLSRCLAVVVFVGAWAPGAAAEDPPPEPEPEPVVHDIVFPVAGEVRFSDDFGAPRSGGRTHAGNDLMGFRLQPLVAAADGEICWVRETDDSSGGVMLFVCGDDGWQYRYMHLNNDTPGTDDGLNPPQWRFAPGIEMGATVTAGQFIAFMGDSGNAEETAPHLHFEMKDETGLTVNPYHSLVAAPRVERVWFEDDDGNIHEPSIEAMAAAQLTRGCGPLRYCPDDSLTRGQLATMLAGALDLPEATADHFDDDNGTTHEDSINRVAEAGIVAGRSEGRYAPFDQVTRGQFATIIARTLGLVEPVAPDPDGTAADSGSTGDGADGGADGDTKTHDGDDPSDPEPAPEVAEVVDSFDDDDGLVHEESIEAIYAAGITSGCAAGSFCPTDSVERDQLATLLIKSLAYEAPETSETGGTSGTSGTSA